MLKPLSNNEKFLNSSLFFLLKSKQIKSLKSKTINLKKKNGRNNSGSLTITNLGGGNKKSYRRIDFFLCSNFLVVEKIEYDPNRTSKIMRFFCNLSKLHFYRLATTYLETGFFLQREKFFVKKLTFSGSLFQIPLGTLLNCVGTKSRIFQGILQRAAGTYAQIIQKGNFFCVVKLSSGQFYFLQSNTFSITGTTKISQSFFFGKAGTSRRKNYRPKVRNITKNAIDREILKKRAGLKKFWKKPTL